MQRVLLLTGFLAGSLVLALLLLPFRVFLKAYCRQKPLRLEVEYSVLRFVKGRFTFDERHLGPYRQKIEEFGWGSLLTAAGRSSTKETLSGLRDLPQKFRVSAGTGYGQSAFRAVLRSTYVEKLRVRASIGSADAALTGYLVGIAWAVAGIVQWAVRQFLPVAGGEPRFLIGADFNSGTIEASVEATLKGRVAPVIAALLKHRFPLLRPQGIIEDTRMQTRRGEYQGRRHVGHSWHRG